MTDVSGTAVEIASELREDDQVAVTRPALYRRVKAETESDAVDHAEVKAALAEEGWEYGRHLYSHPDGVADRVADLASTLRGEGRLIVTHGQVCDRLVGDEERADVEGWQKGPFVDQVTASFAAAGWRTDTIDGSRTRVYLYPLLAAIRDEHPQGRFWRSPAELFGYYLSQSVIAAVGEE